MPEELMQEEEFTSRIDWRVWAGILRFALPYRRHLLGLAASAGAIAVGEASYMLLQRAIIDGAARGASRATFLGYGVAYAVLALWFGAAVFSFISLAGWIATHVGYDIRRAGFTKLQELSFAFYDRHPVGWLIARMTGDCTRLARVIGWGALDAFVGLAVMIGVISMMLWLNLRLALVVMSVLPLMILVSAVAQKRLLATSRAVRRTNSQITASYNETISGVTTTKTLVREEENLGEFTGLTTEIYGASVRNAVIAATYLPVVMTLGTVGSALAVWRGGLGIGDGVSIGTLITFIMYAGFFIWPIRELARVFTQFQAAQAAAERIHSLLETEPDVKDSPAVARAVEANRGRERTEGVAIDGGDELIETIEFRGVSFRYAEGRPVLDGFNLTVPAGRAIALAGPTGGGKSTIVSLLCRFYEPTDGEILINGVDYRGRSLEWLQSNLGIVLQTPQLFTGTIADNIRYGRLDATPEEIERVARLVGAHEFIAATEGGYDAPAGRAGGNLSTGQKQLIALARAVLADPQIFVMDEATSSVDTHTEGLIQRGIRTVLRGRTSFVIAHRLSTIRSADRILVIEDGRIAEDGNHHELILARGKYYGLYVNQFTREKEDEILGPAGDRRG
jgi:ATP-binding cassette subfamily B protein